jgi:hypothetical protein
MQETLFTSEMCIAPDKQAEDFYRHVVQVLSVAEIPFLVGGAYAFNCYTGITRYTKDLDIFIRQQDYERLYEVLTTVGYQVELTYPHWLAKVNSNGEFVDVIFNSGNGASIVDNAWFERAVKVELFGIQIGLCSVEESIWTKAFVMERERFDGADIVHLLRARSEQIDWPHLLQRFGEHWRVLLFHLIAFGFIYPMHRDFIPRWVMDSLLEKIQKETHAALPSTSICYGTLLSREQYLIDIQQWGYTDARLSPVGNMSFAEAANWTSAIQGKH